MINTCYISQSVLLNLAWMTLQWARYLHTQICDSTFIYFPFLSAKHNWKESIIEDGKHSAGIQSVQILTNCSSTACWSSTRHILHLSHSWTSAARTECLRPFSEVACGQGAKVVDLHQKKNKKKTWVELNPVFAAGEGPLRSDSPSSRMNSLSA